jgi:hypothetical protein
MTATTAIPLAVRTGLARNLGTSTCIEEYSVNAKNLNFFVTSIVDPDR